MVVKFLGLAMLEEKPRRQLEVFWPKRATAVSPLRNASLTLPRPSAAIPTAVHIWGGKFPLLSLQVRH